MTEPAGEKATAETLIPWRHAEPCGEIAFYSTRRLEHGDVIEASVFRLLDGGQASDGDIIRCGACGRAIDTRNGLTLGVRQEE